MRRVREKLEGEYSESEGIVWGCRGESGGRFKGLGPLKMRVTPNNCSNKKGFYGFLGFLGFLGRETWMK